MQSQAQFVNSKSFSYITRPTVCLQNLSYILETPKYGFLLKYIKGPPTNILCPLNLKFAITADRLALHHTLPSRAQATVPHTKLIPRTARHIISLHGQILPTKAHLARNPIIILTSRLINILSVERRHHHRQTLSATLRPPKLSLAAGKFFCPVAARPYFALTVRAPAFPKALTSASVIRTHAVTAFARLYVRIRIYTRTRARALLMIRAPKREVAGTRVKSVCVPESEDEG